MVIVRLNENEVSNRMNFKRWILKKAVFTVAIFILFYMLGYALNIVPESITNFVNDTIAFVKDNFGLLAFIFCFSLSCWVVVKLATRRHKDE